MVDGRDAPVVESVEEMAGRFTSELITLTPGWSRKLRDDPDSLQDLERDVHAAFDRGADLLVAGLLAVVMKQPEFLDDCEQTRKQFAQPLSRGRQRTIRMRLLGGLTIWVASLYCTPRKQAGDQEKHSGLSGTIWLRQGCHARTGKSRGPASSTLSVAGICLPGTGTRRCPAGRQDRPANHLSLFKMWLTMVASAAALMAESIGSDI